MCQDVRNVGCYMCNAYTMAVHRDGTYKYLANRSRGYLIGIVAIALLVTAASETPDEGL